MLVPLIAGLLAAAAALVWRALRRRKARSRYQDVRRQRYRQGAAYRWVSSWLFAHRRQRRLTHRPPSEQAD